MEQRSTSKSISSDDPIVGVVGAPHGVRGEVKVQPRTDVAGRFQKGSRFLCDGMGVLVISSGRGATDVLVVRADGSREELLFPAIASVVREVDVAGRRIVVVPQEILE